MLNGLRELCRHRLIWALAACLLGLSACTSNTGPKGKLGALELASTAHSLLNDRWSMQMPAGATTEQAAAPATGGQQSELNKFLIKAGEERLVIEVEELLALAGDDLKKAVEQVVAPPTRAQLQALPLSEPALTGMAIVPPGPETQEELTLVLGLFVAHPDGAVQYLGFFANRAAARDFTGSQRLARAMVQTLRPGARKLDVDGGVQQFAVAPGKSKIQVQLPAGFVTSLQRGHDFEVYRFTRLGTLGEAGDTIGLYIGAHPQMHHVRRGVHDVEKIGGTVLGRPVQWHRWSMGANGHWMQEGIFQLSLGGDSTVHAHIFYSGLKSQLETLGGIVDSLQVQAQQP